VLNIISQSIYREGEGERLTIKQLYFFCTLLYLTTAVEKYKNGFEKGYWQKETTDTMVAPPGSVKMFYRFLFQTVGYRQMFSFCELFRYSRG